MPPVWACSRVAASAVHAAGSLPPFDTYPAITIEDVWPQIDGGRWPIKRVVGDVVDVWADIFKEGHDLLTARVLFRPEDETEWQLAPMELFENEL